MHLLFKWKAKGQVVVACLSGGDGALAHISDLWGFFIQWCCYIPQACQASAPQTCQRLRLITIFAEEESETHKERSELTQF